MTARLPWDHIDVGLEEGFLAARVPQGAQEPAVAAVRQGRRRVRPRDQPGGRAAEDAQASSATTAASRATSSAMREQRLVYLRKLGAEEPRPPAPAVAPGATSRARRRPPRVSATPAVPLRLREARRRGLPVASRRHPRAAACVPPARAAAPLLAGLSPQARHDLRPRAVARRGEPVRGGRREDRWPTSTSRRLLDELSAGAQRGLRFVGGVKLGRRDAGRLAASSTRRATRGHPARRGRRAGRRGWLARCVAKALAAPELVVIRRIDGMGKRVDVRGFLRELRIGRARRASKLARRASWATS